tara:strand:+ start:1456 stop:1587 length:132 start_codon:yes stop_codon:yes gene_type:complete
LLKNLNIKLSNESLRFVIKREIKMAKRRKKKKKKAKKKRRRRR